MRHHPCQGVAVIRDSGYRGCRVQKPARHRIDSALWFGKGSHIGSIGSSLCGIKPNPPVSRFDHASQFLTVPI
jgi:hypothetical protein